MKIISNTKKNCIKEGKCSNRCYFSGSNAFTFIEDLDHQINSVIFNHT